MSNNKRSIDPVIIAALIGVMGTFCVTVVTLYANRIMPPSPPPQPTLTSLPTWTIMPTETITNTPVPTDTVPVGEASSTPEPATLTPASTFTPAPPALGSDWANGCISVLWKPYPATIPITEKDGCLLEPVDLFFADDGRLSFFVSGSFENTEIHGLFAPLPARGTARVQTFLKTLQDVEIWMGVFAEPDIESQGMILVIPAGEVKRRPVVQKAMPGQVELKRTEAVSRNPPIYDVQFDFGDGSVASTALFDQVFDPIPVASAQQWLFVGYKIQEGSSRVDAEFLNLFVQGQ